MKKFTTLLTLLAILLAFSLNAQVAINQTGNNADPNSVLDVRDAANNPAFYVEAATGEVGIGTTNPSQKLDINGNMRISGAIMPNNDAGTPGQLLISEGPGTAATWGAEMLNQPATLAIGKYYLEDPINIPGGFYDMPGILELTVTDPNCRNTPTQTSTCFITWIGELPEDPWNPGEPYYGNLTCTVEAQDGQWIFHIANRTGYNLNNFSFSFVAFY